MSIFKYYRGVLFLQRRPATPEAFGGKGLFMRLFLDSSVSSSGPQPQPFPFVVNF